MSFASENAAVGHRNADDLSDVLDALIFGYLSRRNYELTCKAFVDESPSLNQKLSEHSSDGTTGAAPFVEISLHGKLLEEIVALYAELGSFVAPPQFMQFGLKLRQLSGEFATLMGAGWSESQQRLYGRKTTLPTRTQAVSLASGVRNVQAGPSNFTIVREPLPETVAAVALEFSSPEKASNAGIESRRRKAPPRHLANSNVMQSPLKEASTNQPISSAFPMITFDNFDALLNGGLADTVAEGINRNLHGDLSELQPTFHDFDAIANEILSTDNDAIIKALNIGPGNQPRGSDGGQLSFELPRDGSADEEDLLNGWDPLQNALDSPMKTTRIVVIDEIEEGDVSQSRYPASSSKKADDDLPAKVAETVSLSSSSSSASLFMSSIADGAAQPTKPTKPSQSNSLELAPSSSTASTSASKSDAAVKSKSNRSGSSGESAIASSSSVAEATHSGSGKARKEKSKSSSVESSGRRSAQELKKNDKERIQSKEKRDKEKEKEKEREEVKKKKERIPEPSQTTAAQPRGRSEFVPPHSNTNVNGRETSSKSSPDKSKRPFGLNHVVTKRLYPAHQCASSTNSIFANSDLFESESPTRKRPKHQGELLESAAGQQRPLSKVDSARRKLTDSMQWRSEAPPAPPPAPTPAPPPAPSSAPTAAVKAKDKTSDERRTSAVSAEKRRDIYSPEIARMRSKSRSPSLPRLSTTKARSLSTRESSKAESHQKEKSVHSHKHNENKTPTKVVAQKHPTSSPTAARASSGSTKKKDKTPIPKTVCSGVGKYRPIQLSGGTHSAKVGIVLEKAARARRQAEREKADGGPLAVPEAPSVSQNVQPHPSHTSSQLSPPVKSSPLKRTERSMDDSELIDLSTNTPLTATPERNLVVLRMIDEATSTLTPTATTTPAKTIASPGVSGGSVSDLAAYCEKNYGFSLNLPLPSPPQKVRVDSARMESVLALLHGTKR